MARRKPPVSKVYRELNQDCYEHIEELARNGYGEEAISECEVSELQDLLQREFDVEYPEDVVEQQLASFLEIRIMEKHEAARPSVSISTEPEVEIDEEVEPGNNEDVFWSENVWKVTKQQCEQDVVDITSKYSQTAKAALDRLKQEIFNLGEYRRQLLRAASGADEATRKRINREEQKVDKFRNELARILDSSSSSTKSNNPNSMLSKIQVVQPLAPGVELPKRRWLIDKVLPLRQVTMSYASSGSGKTFFEIEKVVSLTTGKLYLEGLAVEELGDVWYIVADRQAYEIKERFYRALRAYNLESAYAQSKYRLHVMNYWDLGIDFSNPIDLATFIQAYHEAETQPILATLDAFYGIIGNLTLQDTRAANYLRGLQYIAANTKLTFSIPHHAIVDGSKEMGGELVRAAVDMKIQQVIYPDDDIISLTLDKYNNGRIGEQFFVKCYWNAGGEDIHRFELTDEKPEGRAGNGKSADNKTGASRYVGKPSTKDDYALVDNWLLCNNWKQVPVTQVAASIAEVTGFTDSKVNYMLTRMVETGKLVKVKGLEGNQKFFEPGHKFPVSSEAIRGKLTGK